MLENGLRELEDRESSIISEYEAKLSEKQSAMESALARLKRDHEAALLAQMKEHNDAMASAAAKHAAEMKVLCLQVTFAFTRVQRHSLTWRLQRRKW